MKSRGDGNRTTTTPTRPARQSRLLRSRQVIVGYAILAATTVAAMIAFTIALRAVSDRTRDNERTLCTASWDRYDGRVGLRSEMFGLRDRFVKDQTGAAYVDFTDLTDFNAPRIGRPDCPRPNDGRPPERPMP